MGNTLPNLFKRMKDAISASLRVIIFEHSKVHAGESFSASRAVESLGDSDTFALCFKTPVGPIGIHLTFGFTTLVGAHVELIEGPTWTNQTGTKYPIFNRKRAVSMKSSTLLEDQGQAEFVASDNVISNPAAIAGGTILRIIYGFGKIANFSAQGRDATEWILKPDTQYAVRLTADGAANAAELILDWYESKDDV